MVKPDLDEIKNALGILVFASPILALGIWMFNSNDSSVVCGGGGCNSGPALAITAMLAGGFGVSAGIFCLWTSLFPSTQSPSKPLGRSTPYGSVRDYEDHLRKLGVAEEQIRAEVKKYSGV